MTSSMDRTTGAALETTSDAHLQQSVNDILSTPLASRIARREYGSQLAEIIDQPFGPATVQKLYAATATALTRWEKRLKISRVTLSAGTNPGSATLTITGTRTDRPAKAGTTLDYSLSRTN